MAELTANSVNLRRADGSMWWWIERGWRDDPAIAEGSDDIIAQAEGRVPRGRKRRFRRVDLRGQLKGLGATPTAVDAAFLALVEEIDDSLLSTVADPWPLVLGDQYRGLAAGQTATLNVRTINVLPSPGPLSYRRIYTVTVESVDSPPEWVIAP